MAAKAQALSCGNCRREISPSPSNRTEEILCPGCGERLLLRCFPALARGIQATPAAAILAVGEASCFYHPASRAVLPCDSCGRFLCALCDLDLDGRHLCPVCLERGVEVEKAPSLDDRHILYDSVALHLSTWPVFTFWLPIVTAPVALFVAIRHWRTTMSILPRSRVRLWLAVIFSTLQILIIGGLIVAFVWFLPQTKPR